MWALLILIWFYLLQGRDLPSSQESKHHPTSIRMNGRESLMSVTYFSKGIYSSSLICAAFILLESQGFLVSTFIFLERQYLSFFQVLIHEETAKLVKILKPKVEMYINTFTIFLKQISTFLWHCIIHVLNVCITVLRQLVASGLWASLWNKGQSMASRRDSRLCTVSAQSLSPRFCQAPSDIRTW